MIVKITLAARFMQCVILQQLMSAASLRDHIHEPINSCEGFRVAFHSRNSFRVHFQSHDDFQVKFVALVVNYTKDSIQPAGETMRLARYLFPGSMHKFTAYSRFFLG